MKTDSQFEIDDDPENKDISVWEHLSLKTFDLIPSKDLKDLPLLQTLCIGLPKNFFETKSIISFDLSIKISSVQF